MIKLTFCLHRLAHLNRSQFQAYWRDTHAPLVATHADALGIKRYVQTHALSHDLNGAMQESRHAPEMYDGIAELWFDSWDAIQASLETPKGAAAGQALLEDEQKFIDLARSPLWFNEEHRIVG